MKRTLTILALTICLAGMAFMSNGNAAVQTPPITCGKNALAWAGDCFRYSSAVDRTRFALWLRARGVIERFPVRNPAIAKRFGPYFPPTPENVRKAAIAVFSQSSNPNAVDTILCIIGRESGFRFDAYSATDDVGPYQANQIHWSDGSPPMLALMDPLYSARWAYGLSHQGHRFSPWRGGRWSCF